MESKTHSLIDKIEKDKRLDRRIWKICAGSWTLLLLLSFVYTFLIVNQWMVAGGGGIHFFALLSRYESWAEIILTLTVPFIGPFIIFLFAGILSTVAILVRMRTSSLRDIQLRLSTLEGAILSKEE